MPILLLLLLSALPSQEAAGIPADLEIALSFEGSEVDGLPEGWWGGPAGTLFSETVIVHGGQRSGRIERDAGSKRDFSTFTKSIPLEVDGVTLELRGFLRTEGVTGYTGLWMREDGESGSVAFDNMQSRELRGTTDWTEYIIKLPLKTEARKLFFGVLLAGEGRVWVDDLRILLDGRPLREAPKAKRTPTVFDTDKEFEAGSRVTVSRLSPAQVSNLATLCKVWGFLKYHHPRVAAGELHWDFELFRILPRVLEAKDRASAAGALAGWVAGLGAPAPCSPCATPPDGPWISPDLAWLRDRETLGEELAGLLQKVLDNRHASEAQFYVTKQLSVGNPLFGHELAYTHMTTLDAGYRLLALFRYWNIIQYWFPYRDVIGESWDAVLIEFLPRIAAAGDQEAFLLEMLALITRINDGHARLASHPDVLPPRGECALPVWIRFIEGRALVTDAAEPAGGLKMGDEIAALDGIRVESLVKTWAPWYSASNEGARLLGMARNLTRGECRDVEVLGSRPAGTFKVTLPRRRIDAANQAGRWTHDLPGETMRLLSPEVAYLKLSTVKEGEAESYIRRAAGTRGLVLDLRNYPSANMVFELGQHLVAEPAPFVRFSFGSLSNPGAFSPGITLNIAPAAPRYEGSIVILVDEVSLSHAEYTAMAFRAAPGAVIVGSPTAGADGNVSTIPLPGGSRTSISGIGVFYPDGSPTQRVGIVPDIVARPTIQGIREGRDEVLEVALRKILGEGVPEARIRAMAKPR
ncbi:MAG: S41 family peptidase [Candidatus Polarisedimenticolia bacterium]